MVKLFFSYVKIFSLLLKSKTFIIKSKLELVFILACINKYVIKK